MIRIVELIVKTQYVIVLVKSQCACSVGLRVITLCQLIEKTERIESTDAVDRVSGV